MAVFPQECMALIFLSMCMLKCYNIDLTEYY